MKSALYFSRKTGNLVLLGSEVGGVTTLASSAIDGAFSEVLRFAPQDEKALGDTLDRMFEDDAVRVGGGMTIDHFHYVCRLVRKAFNNEGRAVFSSANDAAIAVSVLKASGLMSRAWLVRIAVPAKRSSLVERQAELAFA